MFAQMLLELDDVENIVDFGIKGKLYFVGNLANSLHHPKRPIPFVGQLQSIAETKGIFPVGLHFEVNEVSHFKKMLSSLCICVFLHALLCLQQVVL
jgi:hypothetical protein